jgi:hypothetical protein
MKQLGYLVVDYYSKEGDVSKATFFVEASKSGFWTVYVEIFRSDSRGGYKNNKTKYSAYKVERIEPPLNGLVKKKLIPDTESRPAHLYRLLLKDKKGNVLITI